MRSPIAILSIALLSFALAGAPAEAARARKSKSASRDKPGRGAGAKRAAASTATRGTLARRARATVHKRKLRGADAVMASIARSPGLGSAPIADSFIRGKFFFGDPVASFRGSKAQRAILGLARRLGTHDGTFELRDPSSRKVVGYYSQISTGPTAGVHVFHDRRGGRVATTAYDYGD